MTSRNWVKLFFTTLMIGALTTGIAGFIVRWNEFEPFFANFNLVEILAIFGWLLGVGLIFSIISQMGFFAYLTVHRFGLGIFRSVSLWNSAQIVLILFVLVDLVYLRYNAFAKEGESILSYLGMAMVVLLAGLATAYMKVKQTNRDSFVPALFFMVVVTVIEWMPALRVNDSSWVYLMLFPLLACNAYQLLVLHKLNTASELQRKMRTEGKPSKNNASSKTKSRLTK